MDNRDLKDEKYSTISFLCILTKIMANDISFFIGKIIILISYNLDRYSGLRIY